MAPESGPPALAIDAAEWFLDPGWRAFVPPRHWRRLPSRAAIAIGMAAEGLAGHGVRATFFAPAAVASSGARQLAGLIAAGHEVALSFAAPAPLQLLDAAARRRLAAELVADQFALEAATGRRVCGLCGAFPESRPDWWPELLQQLGFLYDATPPAGSPPDAPRELAAGRASARVHVFAARLLDAGAPRLSSLPRQLARAAAAARRTAAPRLAAVCRQARVPIAAALGLTGGAPAPAAVAAPAPPGPERCRGGPVPRLPIVVPLKDEAEGVPSLLAELDHIAAELRDHAAVDFVLVDDGSLDRTWELLQRHGAGRPRLRLLRHEHNRGVAAAIRTGIEACDTEFVASIDGDLSYDPRELGSMLALAAAADVVTASPYHPRGSVANVPRWRLLLSRGLSRIYRLLLRQPIHTWTSCCRVYRRAFVGALPLAHGGFLGTAELLIRVLRRGGRVVEHPCALEARLLGSSKLRVARTVGAHLLLIWDVLRGRIR